MAILQGQALLHRVLDAQDIVLNLYLILTVGQEFCKDEVLRPEVREANLDEISSISDSFNILLYYRDGRRQGADFIKDKLTRKHSIFAGGIESARTIVITS
ncbi:hypothetical protein AnigIFM56816_006764 [Aspergillus niger]|nr:hypothetical protein AnigIFM56816_006764 [Aspergillus niger]